VTTKVLVCGGRKYAHGETTTARAQRNRMWATLDSILAHYGDVLVIHGGAPGADTYAEVWASHKGVHSCVVRARWNLLGPEAGKLRNTAMAALAPDVVVAFPGGPGTGHMVYTARRANIPVYVIEDAV
jgi:hypothetical protein